MSLIAIKFLLILFLSRQGLICLFSFASLLFVSYARGKFKEGMIKDIVDNILALSFVTYLFTFFNILIKGKFIVIGNITGEFILNVFIVLIIVVIIKTTVDIMNYSKDPRVRKTLKKIKRISKKN